MRLTQREKNAIISGLNNFMLSQKSELRLFGSRANDSRKGGDIDLLLIVPDRNIKASLLLQKPEILAAIKIAIGDRCIDLKIATTADLLTDPFLQIIYPQSILLHSFASSI